MTIADVFFAIGKTHDICQDYGLADDPVQSDMAGAKAYAIVCDGCSSSANTDWGARFLARSAASASYPFNALNVVERADYYRQALQLHPSALDATLIRAQELPSGDVEVIACGDGVIVARRRDGSGYYSVAISYSHNAPAYLSYLLDAGRLAAYRKAGGGIKTLIENGTGYMSSSPIRVNNPDDVVRDLNQTFHRVFSRAEYDVVLVMTDGAESFQRREGTKLVMVPLVEVLDQVLDFKTVTHGFLKRRLKRFLGKFCAEKGWQHNDDFAVAGLVMDPPLEGVK